jgi:hypothetical protein
VSCGRAGRSDQWRQNIPELSKAGRVFAIDLLGYGYSAKPDPKAQAAHTLYTFDTWADQLNDFIEQMVGEPAFLVTNSIGGVAGLQVRPCLCAAAVSPRPPSQPPPRAATSDAGNARLARTRTSYAFSTLRPKGFALSGCDGVLDVTTYTPPPLLRAPRPPSNRLDEHSGGCASWISG